MVLTFIKIDKFISNNSPLKMNLKKFIMGSSVKQIINSRKR